MFAVGIPLVSAGVFGKISEFTSRSKVAPGLAAADWFAHAPFEHLKKTDRDSQGTTDRGLEGDNRPWLATTLQKRGSTAE